MNTSQSERSKRSEPCLFYTLERSKRSEFCLFHKFKRTKWSELCLFHKFERTKRSEVCLYHNLVYSKNRQDQSEKKKNWNKVKRTEVVFLKLLWSPGVDSMVLIPPTHALAGLYNNPIPARFLAPLDCSKACLQIRAQATLDSGMGSMELIPGLLKCLQMRAQA